MALLMDEVSAQAEVARLIRPGGPAFALLQRSGTTAPDHVELLVGSTRTVAGVAELTRRGDQPGPAHDLLALVPYRQLTERGYACQDDGTPLVVLEPRTFAEIPIAAVHRAVSDTPVTVRDGRFATTDDEYAEQVRRVIADEIGRGRGANFVIKRSYLAQFAEYSARTAITVFVRLLAHEQGSYWTFLVHTGDRTLVGASPECHLTLRGGVATMNPISGTYPYPAGGATEAGLLEFLADAKESDELFMVLDEELKMMSRVCEPGVRATGPQLKAMANLAHTEYFIEGTTTLDVPRLLAETMFAPTVTGSPVQSACEVIARHENSGRGYYSGAVVLIGRDTAERPTLDSAIMIRTADIGRSGDLRLDVGATLVRHSQPLAEAAETRAKAAGLLAALERGAEPGVDDRAEAVVSRLAASRQVRDALLARNAGLAPFWLSQLPLPEIGDKLRGRAVVVDCEDTFTSMLAHQLIALGLAVDVVSIWDDPPIDADLLVMGPGPGDPRLIGDPKIAKMRRITAEGLSRRIPLLAICLGHQVLASLLGLPLVRRAVPSQGVQRQVDFFGRRELCGFYNTYAAQTDYPRMNYPSGTIDFAHDPESGEIHAMRAATFGSVQFHPESVLTEHGTRLIRELAAHVLRIPATVS